MESQSRTSPIGFFAELKRRKVLQIGGAYIAGAWLVTEVLSFLFDQFQAPDWGYRMIAIVFVAGFPISMILAWMIQVGADGSWTIDRSRGENKTLIVAIVLGLAITVGLAWLTLPQMETEPRFQPLPGSLAVLSFASTAETASAQTAAESLYFSVMEGLEQAVGLTLIRLRPGEKADDPQAFAESLGVAGLASGRMIQSETGTKVEVAFRDVVAGEVTWSGDFPWEPTQGIETANAIANNLLQAMGLPALDERQFTGTNNREAYEAFMSGETLAGAWTAESLAGAIEDYQRAIDLDPGFVQAYIGFAQSLYDLADLAGAEEDEHEEMERRARRAVNIAQRLEPESADALSLIGLGQSNRQMRIVAYERALELDPDHYMSYYRYALQMKADGKLDEAERLIRRAISLQPMSARFRMELAEILSLQGRADEAEAELKKAAAFRH
jgi:tetratricopeptide (TPR) repeat protein